MHNYSIENLSLYDDCGGSTTFITEKKTREKVQTSRNE